MSQFQYEDSLTRSLRSEEVLQPGEFFEHFGLIANGLDPYRYPHCLRLTSDQRVALWRGHIYMSITDPRRDESLDIFS